MYYIKDDDGAIGAELKEMDGYEEKIVVALVINQWICLWWLARWYEGYGKAIPL